MVKKTVTILAGIFITILFQATREQQCASAANRRVTEFVIILHFNP